MKNAMHTIDPFINGDPYSVHGSKCVADKQPCVCVLFLQSNCIWDYGAQTT